MMKTMPFRIAAISLVLLITSLACSISTPTSVLPTPPPARARITGMHTAVAVERPSITPESPTDTITAVREETVDDFFARCPTAEEIADLNRDLRLSFESDPTTGTLVCQASLGSADLTSLQKRAYQSVIVMHYLRFSRPLSWTDRPLYDWFINAIHGLRFRDDFTYSHCCDPADTIDILVAGNSFFMTTDRWMDPAQGGGLMNTMILYVHEARHNEGKTHNCPNGTDDRTFAEMGAWGVQASLDEWIGQYADRAFLRAPGPDPDLYRRTALLAYYDILRTHFCANGTPPAAPPTLIP
jgi:hypothetical protein